MRQEAVRVSLALSHADERRSSSFHHISSVLTGKGCFVRKVVKERFVKWKIFTSKEDYRNYMATGKHKR
jgi:hypothetical protein